MKKILATICLAVITTSAAFAGESIKSPGKHFWTNISISTDKTIQQVNIKDDDCTVSVTGSIGVGSTSLAVTCSATASTCDAASTQAIACVSGAIKKVRAML